MLNHSSVGMVFETGVLITLSKHCKGHQNNCNKNVPTNTVPKMGFLCGWIVTPVLDVRYKYPERRISAPRFARSLL